MEVHYAGIRNLLPFSDKGRQNVHCLWERIQLKHLPDVYISTGSRTKVRSTTPVPCFWRVLLQCPVVERVQKILSHHCCSRRSVLLMLCGRNILERNLVRGTVRIVPQHYILSDFYRSYAHLRECLILRNFLSEIVFRKKSTPFMRKLTADVLSQLNYWWINSTAKFLIKNHGNRGAWAYRKYCCKRMKTSTFRTVHEEIKLFFRVPWARSPAQLSALAPHYTGNKARISPQQISSVPWNTRVLMHDLLHNVYILLLINQWYFVSLSLNNAYLLDMNLWGYINFQGCGCPSVKKSNVIE